EFKSVHSDGITCLEFSRDNQKILTGSLDNTCRLHGMHSGRTLKEFRGHTSYVNCVGFADGPGHQRLVVSGSADGFIRVFDLRSSEILHKFPPPPPSYQNENITLDVRDIVIVPSDSSAGQSEDSLLICQQSSTVHHMTVSGQLLKSYESGKRDGKGDFVLLCTSHAGRWIYAAAEDRTMELSAVLLSMFIHTSKLLVRVPSSTPTYRARKNAIRVIACCMRLLEIIYMSRTTSYIVVKSETGDPARGRGPLLLSRADCPPQGQSLASYQRLVVADELTPDGRLDDILGVSLLKPLRRGAMFAADRSLRVACSCGGISEKAAEE
ncbi:Serine/threonine-protein kinase smu1, partial [Perkinsus olseni]